MATITFNQNRKSMLLWLHTENGCPTQCITGKTQHSAIQWLRDNDYIEFRSNIKGYYEWLVTPKGVEWLDAHMPMVDQPQPADDNDDLPFSDLGVDDEDTKELPAITVDESTPTLSNLIDAALDPNDTEAYAALTDYDWASVPLWCIEIERDDVNAYKWEIWHEHRKMSYSITGSNPEYIAKQLEVNRAFDVVAILNKVFEQGVK